jgi:paraquat-inducible protein B
MIRGAEEKHLEADRSTAEHSHAADVPAPTEELPEPIIKRSRWPYPLIWLVPLLAAVFAGYYYYNYEQNNWMSITVRFADATGLRPEESQVQHLGVQIGQVSDVRLTPDNKQALVIIRLARSESDFARTGSLFWIVKPEISTQQISGLGTVLSGPIIDSTAGTGDLRTEFVGLPKAPRPKDDGISIVLKIPQVGQLQPDSPVTYRGIQVGVVQDVRLASDGATADVHVLIQRRFVPLVKTNSQFWVVAAVDVKGGLFGLQMKVDSLRSLLVGGVAFATPEQKMGDQAVDGSTFVLHDQVKPEWLTWAPKIYIGAEGSNDSEGLSLPPPPDAIRSAVGTK